MTVRASYRPSANGRRAYSRLLIPGTVLERLPFVIVLIFLLGGACLYAADGDPSAAVEKSAAEPVKASSLSDRYRVFSLRHITAEKGKEYLAVLGLGTVSQLPGANMLLVTAQPSDLKKAGVVLELVDKKEPFVIEVISAVSPESEFGSREQLAAAIGEVLIGSFSNPPEGTMPAKAIVDIHDGKLIAVAPQNQIEKIVSALEMTDTQAPLPVEPAVLEVPAAEDVNAVSAGPAASEDANVTGSDAIFGRLLESLAEAEKRAADRKEEVSEPNEPEIVIIPAEPCEPTVVAPVAEPCVPTEPLEPVVPVEAVEEPGELTKDDAVALILRRLEALEAGLKAKAEPKAEPVPQRPPELEQPPETAPKITPTTPAVPKIQPPNEVNVPAAKATAYEAVGLQAEDAVLSVDFPEDLPLANFLEFVGKQLQLNLLYNPEQMKAFKVTIRVNGELRGPMTVRELYETLQSTLQFYGFSMTRQGRLLVVGPMTEADIRDPMLLQTAEDRPKVGDVVVTRVFELEHISTVTARNLLTGMKLGIGPPREIAETGTLIVTGYAYRMPRIEQLLDLVDKPGEPKQFKFRQLKYTMAQVLAPKIKTLVEQLGEISITVAQPTAVPGRPDPRRTRPPRPQRGRPPQPTPPTASAAPAAAAEPGQPTVYLDFDERTNRVLMIGFEKELGIVEDLISSLDVAQQDLRTMRLYQMEHVDAEEVRMKLEELGIISPTRAVSTSGRFRTGRPGAGRTDRTPVRTDRTGRPGTPAAAAAAAAAGTVAAGTSSEEPLVEEPQVVIVETVNSLLVNATAEQHARIATIIGYVDSIPEGRDIPYVVYPLENQDPIELAETLNKLILETTEKQEKDAKIVTHTSRTEEEIIIIPDPKTYSLIVYASKRNQSWIRALIEQLDEYRPQVLLDCTLVEIFKNDEFSLAIDWLQAFPDLTEVSGKIPSLADAVLPETRKRFIEFDASGSAFYGDEHINLLLTAVQTRNYGRVLARPKILVNDNELGAIKTEETQYIVRVESQVSAGTTGTTSTTRSSVNFESYNAGITLEIEPHISKGDQLRLKITMIRSDFRETPPATVTDPDSGEQRTIEKPPDTVTSDIQTTVTVPDNFTVILGGLEKLNQTKGGSKVPFLGDIPFIGGLFRNTSNKDTQARLYVFVKAHILRPGDQLDGDSTMEVVSRKSRTTFERHEREMQEYEDWPGIKATPMDPLQVLTSD